MGKKKKRSRKGFTGRKRTKVYNQNLVRRIYVLQGPGFVSCWRMLYKVEIGVF